MRKMVSIIYEINNNNLNQLELIKYQSPKLANDFKVALDPRLEIGHFELASCNVLKSKKKPLW